MTTSSLGLPVGLWQTGKPSEHRRRDSDQIWESYSRQRTFFFVLKKMLLEKVNRQHSVSLSLFLNLSLSLSVYLYLNLLLVKNSSKYFPSLKLVILVKNHDWKDVSAACQMKTWRPKAGREREFVHFWPKIYMKLWCMIRLQLHISSHRLFNQHPMPRP